MQLSHKIIAHNSPVARLYELQSQAIFAYLRRQTGSREDAEDALVEVFVAALEAETLNRLSEKEQIAWLWRVARNKAVDTYRRSQVRQGMDLSLAEDQSDDESKAPEQIALQRESASLLHRQLEKLSPVQREALRLRFANGLRCAEIGVILGKREGTVRSILSRALDFLRTLYEKDQEETHL